MNVRLKRFSPAFIVSTNTEPSRVTSMVAMRLLSGGGARPLFEGLVPAVDVLVLRIDRDLGELGEAQRGEQRAVGDRRLVARGELVVADLVVEDREIGRE